MDNKIGDFGPLAQLPLISGTKIIKVLEIAKFEGNIICVEKS
jgi:hypothetical protein